MPNTTTRRPSHDRTAAAGSRRANATQAPSQSPAADEWLTVAEVCAELKIGQRTFERWRSKGIAPRAKPLVPNGPLRVRRSWLEEFMKDDA
jgi:hypothetical protein